MEEIETAKANADITETEMQQVTKPKNKIGEAFRNYFTATRMAYLAVFTALAYVLYMPF